MSDYSGDKEERKLTAYERWELPHLEQDNPTLSSGPAVLVQKNTVVTTEEVDQSTLVYEPLTALQLEEIRSSAYEEGFIQGEGEGYRKGHEDGFSKGEVDGFEKGHEGGLLIGTDEGEAQAKLEAQSQLASIEALLADVVKEIVAPLEESRDAVEALLCQSMTRIIENVCLSKMNQDGHKILKEQLSRVFEEIGEYEGRIRLDLHPEDISVLEGLGVKDRLALQVKSDDTLVHGSFLIDSKSFHIDGRVEQRLESVFDELRQLSVFEDN